MELVVFITISSFFINRQYKRQRAKGKGQKAKGKRQRAKSKKAKGKEG